MVVVDLERLGFVRKAQPLTIAQDKFQSAIILIVCLIIAAFVFLCSSFNMTPAKADVVSVAQTQIGLGELGGNNRGIYIRQYLNGRENLPWCAGFVSYCLKKSGTHIPYTLRAKDFLSLGKKVNNPQAGDLIVFFRQGGGHVGIVEKVTQDTLITIEGNLGNYPSKVKRVTYKRNHIKNLLSFVRLARSK